MRLEAEYDGDALVVREGNVEARVVVPTSWTAKVSTGASEVYLSARLVLEACGRGMLAELAELAERARRALLDREHVEEVVRAALGEGLEEARLLLDRYEREAPGDEPKAYDGGDRLIIATRRAAYSVVARDFPVSAIVPGLPVWAYDLHPHRVARAPPNVVRALASDPAEGHAMLETLFMLTLAHVGEREVDAALRKVEGEDIEALRRAVRRLERRNAIRAERRRAVELAASEIVALEDGAVVPSRYWGSSMVYLVDRQGRGYRLYCRQESSKEVLRRIIKRRRLEPYKRHLEPPDVDDVREVKEVVRERKSEVGEKAPWLLFVL